MSQIVNLLWPDKGLSPNSRTHFRRLTVLKRDARWDGYNCALEHYNGKLEGRTDNIPLRLTFYPPDKRKRDLDNAFASCKAALDGVAEALMVNDRQFWPVTLTWGEVRTPPEVVLEIDP